MNIYDLKKLPNGSGGYGCCYIVDDETLYKRFHKQKDGSYPFAYNYFDKFYGLENDSFVFPKEIDVEGDYTIGYTMNYIHADTLEVLDFDFSINDFIIALDKLKEGLYEVTNQGIVVLDVNAKNMLYDGDFHIIDTDLFLAKGESDFDPYDVNEDYVVSYLHSYITQEKCPYEIGKIINYNDDLKYFDKRLTKDANISDLKNFLYELKDSVSRLANRNIDNFTELYDEVSVIR